MNVNRGFSIRLALIVCFLAILFLTGPQQHARAQEVKISKVVLNGEQVEIFYDLKDENPDHGYILNLYSSRDNYIQPLQAVEGDIGIDVKVGGNKRIIWNAKEELGESYNGAIALELKGSLYVPFIEMAGILEGQTFKRGKPYDVVWTGGRGDNILNFELYQGESLVRTFEERPNTGNTIFEFPTKIKPGEDYRLRISDTRNRDEVVFTNSFSVKRKIPLGFKIGAAFAIGALTGYLINELKPTVEPDIPEPPLPTR